MSVQLSVTRFVAAQGEQNTAVVVEFVGERVLDDEHAEQRVQEQVETEFVDFVREQQERPCALILRMAGPRGRWLAQSERGEAGIDAICVAMVQAQLPTYLALFREGIDAIVHTDLPRPVAASLRRAGPELARRSRGSLELTPERWLFQNLSTFLVQPYDLVLRDVLPQLSGVLARRARYVRERLSPAADIPAG